MGIIIVDQLPKDIVRILGDNKKPINVILLQQSQHVLKVFIKKKKKMEQQGTSYFQKLGNGLYVFL